METEKPKYFITVPYPYTSGSLHVGHARSYTLGDITARYYKMRGFDVLFPMAFHISGTPILAISKKIEKNDKETIELHKEYVSFYEKDSKKIEEIVKGFENPENLANYYAGVIKNDFEMMGYDIDWSRSFNTGESIYNKFIEWQYMKLQDKGYIKKGKHAVYYCPKCDNPVTTDDIKGGDEFEIEMAEYYLIKEKFEDGYIIAATLRPETLFGVTNLWVNEDEDYVRAKVDNEIWYVSEKSAIKLKKQRFNIDIIDKFKGDYFIEKDVEIPLLEEKVKIYSAIFVDAGIATGIVNSVPMHAPYDYIALRDIGKENLITKSKKIINSSISIGEVIKEIKNQKDEKLEKATHLLYKDEFYNGITNEKCKEFKNLKVAEAKERIVRVLKENKMLGIMYENNIQCSGKIINAKCRCGSEIEIRVLEDQWFLDYSNKEWKKITRDLLKNTEIVPAVYRTAFENTIDWLREWPCTRNRGLGTKFPFDKKWMIESLSDSTIYMAFYTISYYLRKLNPSELDERFFDYVFLGKKFEGCERYKEIRETFLHYYPLDERRTGIAHIQNHLTFMMFHHAAIFPMGLGPRKISLNEMLISEGKKMSKSLGNVVPLKRAVEKYGADTVRFYLAYAADPDTTLDWRENLVENTKNKLFEFSKLVNTKGSRNEAKEIDKWIISRQNEYIKECSEHIRNSQYRIAIQKGFFELLNDMKWYLRRGAPNPGTMSIISEKWIRLMSVFIPFMCKDLWKNFSNEDLEKQGYPQYDPSLSNKKVEIKEEMIKDVLDRARRFVDLISKHKKVKKIFIYIAEERKMRLFEEIKKGKGIKEIMENEEFKKHTNEIISIIKKFNKDELGKIGILTQEDEFQLLEDAKDFIKKELNLEVEIYRKATYDPENKSKFSLPLKPAIYIE